MSNIKLDTPFQETEVEWRAQKVGYANGKPYAMVLCYVQNRAIMDRLDNVCGPMNWQNQFKEWKNNSQLCGISIFDKEKKEWITKWDGAEETDIEKIKGGLSDSMKRAAVQWGIGRYLYKLEATFAECSEEKQKGWTQAKAKKKKEDKDDTVFYWKIPKLPQWAVYYPEIEAANQGFNDKVNGLRGK